MKKKVQKMIYGNRKYQNTHLELDFFHFLAHCVISALSPSAFTKYIRRQQHISYDFFVCEVSQILV